MDADTLLQAARTPLFLYHSLSFFCAKTQDIKISRDADFDAATYIKKQGQNIDATAKNH